MSEQIDNILKGFNFASRAGVGLTLTSSDCKILCHWFDGIDKQMSTEQSNSDVSMTQDVLTDIKTGQSVEKETCSWIQEDDPDICYWKTGCGNGFYFTEGTPTDNNMKYCCYCGKLLKQED